MKKGFTLIELLVVIAISAMVSTIALIYTSTARNEVALTIETSKVAQILLQAKNLAISTYNANPGTCGFGVMFNIPANMYSIFAYNPTAHLPEHAAAPPCPQSTVASTGPIFADEIKEYSAGTWHVAVANGVKLTNGSAGDAMTAVLFYPPAPDTFISRDNGSPYNFLDSKLVNVTSKVYLTTSDGANSAVISVNDGGQVTF